MESFIVMLGTYLVLANKYNNYLDDQGNLAEEDYNNIDRRALLAMLVHGIYYRDLNFVEKGVAWFLDYNNKRANRYRKEHWNSYPCRVSQKELKDLGLAFLRPNRSHSNPNAPGLVIVLRGTIPNKMNDLAADLKIAWQGLHDSSRIRRTVTSVFEVVNNFREENPSEQICMAGHSLGAAIALIVGGNLYSDHRIDIDTHCFNPPLMTIVDVLTGKMNPADSDGVRHAGQKIASWLKEKIINFCGDRAAKNNECAQFQDRRQWTPTLYINPWDLFCLGGKKIFGTPVETPGDAISLQGLLSKFFSREARYFRNIVPSAHVYISHWKEKKRVLAHSLRQWHKYDIKHIKMEYLRIEITSRAAAWGA